MVNTLISVIVPIYNVEKYLSQCLESIINQTYRDIEIICIDDASTDGSLNILREYAQKDTRIKVISNNQNCGVSNIRNQGLAIASGEYIHFVDSDDWIDKDLYKTMIDYIEEYNPQVICFSFSLYDQKKKKLISNYSYNGITQFKGLVNPQDNPLFFDNNEVVWKSLYNKNFLDSNNIKFTSLPCFEDTPFFIEVLLKAQKIFVTQEVFYYYRSNRKKSLIYEKEKYFDYYFDWYDIMKKLLRNTNDDKIIDVLKYITVRAFIINYKNLLLKNIKKAYSFWNQIKQFYLEENLCKYVEAENSYFVNNIKIESVIFSFIILFINFNCYNILNKLKKIKKKNFLKGSRCQIH